MVKDKKFALAEKELAILLKKHGVKLDFEMNFPKYRILPDEVQLALSVLGNHGVKIELSLAKK